MFKKVANGQFRSTGIIFTKYHFHVGKLKSSRGYSPSQYQKFVGDQKQIPVALMDDLRNGNHYWAYQGEFYVENENFTAQEIQALVFEKKRKKERRVRKAVTLMEQESNLSNRERILIPDDVKIFVWKRDGGKCVKCGSNENIEFDHIIPFSLGGGNSARNLQLLCESCNREKGNSLA